MIINKKKFIINFSNTIFKFMYRYYLYTIIYSQVKLMINLFTKNYPLNIILYIEEVIFKFYPHPLTIYCYDFLQLFL